MADYKWGFLEPISAHDREIDLHDINVWYETWRTSKGRLETESPTGFTKFNERLIRSLSVETGILEQLYDIDEGTTETLVTNGFDEEYVGRSNTNIEPSRLIDVLKDHEAAIRIVDECVAGDRELSIGFINQLHATLTRNQSTALAVDQFGNKKDVPLLKAKFKESPNNPTTIDGSVHEYCPPIHVASEMDNLLRLLSTYDDEDPIIVTAWLHHRFTQIHPYQDGNGRVARALSTLILLRRKLLPFVIDRSARVDYLDALEKADFGNLAPLADLFASLEQKTILQALSFDADSEGSQYPSLTSEVINSLSQKFGKRRQEQQAELRTVNDVAVKLRKLTTETVDRGFDELKIALAQVTQSESWVYEGGPDKGTAHYYKFQVTETAKEAGVFANLSEDHYFVKASFSAIEQRLVFVTSFHHVGRELSGIMEATSFAELYSSGDPDDVGAPKFIQIPVKPFTFTYRTETPNITEPFTKWVDRALAIAVKAYGDLL